MRMWPRMDRTAGFYGGSPGEETTVPLRLWHSVSWPLLTLWAVASPRSPRGGRDIRPCSKFLPELFRCLTTTNFQTEAPHGSLNPACTAAASRFPAGFTRRVASSPPTLAGSGLRRSQVSGRLTTNSYSTSSDLFPNSPRDFDYKA